MGQDLLSQVSELDNIECENLDKNKSLFYPKITTTGKISDLNKLKISESIYKIKLLKYNWLVYKQCLGFSYLSSIFLLFKFFTFSLHKKTF